MKTVVIGLVAAAALLVAGNVKAVPRKEFVAKGQVVKGQVVKKQVDKPLHKMTKQEKIRVFFEMAREMGRVPRSCRYRGKRFWGKVKIVKNFPDFKVQIVNNFPDLKVKWVNNFFDKCGKWKKVRNFPDFKIKLVRNFPDFKIKIVRNFPGVR